MNSSSVSRESVGDVRWATGEERSRLLQRALGLEYWTVGWNLIEGIVAVSAALAAGSDALLGFGIDSFVESSSAAAARRYSSEHGGSAQS